MDTNFRNEIDRNSDVPFNTTTSGSDVYGLEGMNRDSWKVMFERLQADMSRLFAKESLLIRTEVAEKVKEAKVAAGSLAVGGVLLFVGLFALTATAIILLDQVMNLWIASAIVTAVLFLVGFIMVKGASKKLEGDRLKPRQSIETLGEIKTTFKERINEFKHH